MNDENNKETSIKQIQNSIEDLLNTKTSLKIKYPTKEDKEKEIFIKIITELEILDTRSFFLKDQAGLDLSSYDVIFYNVIDDLMLLYFGEKVVEIIDFYLYRKHNLDGSVNNILDEQNRIIPLENATDLWNLIQIIKSTAKKKK